MRVLLMEINQESNSFCAASNTLENYRNCCLYEGGEIPANIAGKQVAVGGMLQALREDGVEKAKKQALKKLREKCLNSMAGKLRRASRMVDRAISLEQLP